MNVRPHVAQNMSGGRSAIDQRTTDHPGMPTSARPQADREAFGWNKTVASWRQTKPRGLAKVDPLPRSTGPSPSRPPPAISCGTQGG
jgi:hypothetical protein